jgi:hypothetical protein
MSKGTYFHKGALHGINLARAMSEPHHFIYDGDNFSQLQATGADGALGGYITSGAGTEVLTQVALLPGVCANLETGVADNDSCMITRQTLVGAFDITIGSGRELAFESRFMVLQGSYVGIFVGLADATATEDALVADTTGILGNYSCIGFHCLMHDTDVDIDGVNRIIGGATQTGAETMTEDADAVFHVYGFRFDGNKTIDWFLDNKKFGASQTIAAATFPTGVSLIPMFLVKVEDGDAARNLKIDYWQCVQTLLSEDNLDD